MPLIATLEFSLRPEPATRAYSNVLADRRFFGGLVYSFIVGLITIVISLGIIVPTAYSLLARKHKTFDQRLEEQRRELAGAAQPASD